MTTPDGGHREPTAPDNVLDQWLAERADEVGLVGPARAQSESTPVEDPSFDPDPWVGVALPVAELTPEQREFLGALDALPDLARGADLADRPAWDLGPSAEEGERD